MVLPNGFLAFAFTAALLNLVNNNITFKTKILHQNIIETDFNFLWIIKPDVKNPLKIHCRLKSLCALYLFCHAAYLFISAFALVNLYKFYEGTSKLVPFKLCFCPILFRLGYS